MNKTNNNNNNLNTIQTRTQTKRPEIVITQQRMAGWLMYNGFNCIKTKPDLKDNTRKIYIFRLSPELESTMTRYINTKYL